MPATTGSKFSKSEEARSILKPPIGLAEDKEIVENLASTIEAYSSDRNYTRGNLALRVAKELESQIGLSRLQDFDAVVFVPVVAFGNQTNVLNRTLPQASAQEGKNLYVFLFNHRSDKLPDGDIAAKFKTIKKAFDGTEQSACCLLWNGGIEPKMGDYRNGMIAGYLDALSKAAGHGELEWRVLNNKVLFTMDDDMVKMPANFVESVRRMAVRKEMSPYAMIASQTRFDMPEIPSTMLPAFHYAEAFRHEAAKQVLDVFSTLSSWISLPHQSQRLAYELVFSKVITQVIFTPIAFRASMFSSYIQFPERHEIMGLARVNAYNTLSRLPFPEYTAYFGIINSGLDVTMDSRRSLKKYIETSKFIARRASTSESEVDSTRKFYGVESLSKDLKAAYYAKREATPMEIASQILAEAEFFDRHLRKEKNNMWAILSKTNVSPEVQRIVLEPTEGERRTIEDILRR